MSQSIWSARVLLQLTWTGPKVRSDRNRRMSYLSYKHPKVFLAHLALLPGLLMCIILAHRPSHREHIRDLPPPLDILAPRWALHVSSPPLWSYRQMNWAYCTLRSLAGPPSRPPFGQQNYGPQGSQQPFFQYSQCNGRKKALCVSLPPNSVGKTWHLTLPPTRSESTISGRRQH
jgi:hypothetical protein